MRPLLVAIAVLGVAVAQADETCPSGQTIGPDTAGHCCWPQQAWSASRAVCVGLPACPSGFEARGETCVAASACPDGQRIDDETRGHCCWVGQVWSTSRAVCVGIPQCPAGMQPTGETCVAATSEPYQLLPATPPPAAAAAPAAVASPPPAPPSARVALRFEPRDHADDRFRIEADGKSCVTPCSLELPVGALTLRADSGTRSLPASLVVPSEPATVTVSHPSRVHQAVGAALIAVGAADAALGFWFALGNGFDAHEAVGAVNIVVGVAATVIGIVDLALARRARVEVRAAPRTAALGRRLP